MFKKTDNIVFDRINQMKDIIDPPTQLQKPLAEPQTNLTNENAIGQSPEPPKPPKPEIKSEPVSISELDLTGDAPEAQIPPAPSNVMQQNSAQQLLVHPPNVKSVQQTVSKDVDQFKQICKQWLALNDDIKKLQGAIKVRRQFQNELTPKMMSFMRDKQIEDLDTGDGKLKYTITNRKAPLNKENIQKKLSEYFKDTKQAENVATFLMDNRDIVKSERLSRTMLKKKL